MDATDKKSLEELIISLKSSIESNDMEQITNSTTALQEKVSTVAQAMGQSEEDETNPENATSKDDNIETVEGEFREVSDQDSSEETK